MCTLSIIPQEDKLIVTMNRDEQRTRDEAEQLSITEEGCFPIDSVSSGTWVGVSTHGIVFALLNRYQDKHKSDVTYSRGTIIPALLTCVDLDAVTRQLQMFNTAQFAPFDCFAITPQQLTHAAWNGEMLSITTQPCTNLFATSLHIITEVTQYRHRLFAVFLEKHSL